MTFFHKKANKIKRQYTYNRNSEWYAIFENYLLIIEWICIE